MSTPPNNAVAQWNIVRHGASRKLYRGHVWVCNLVGIGDDRDEQEIVHALNAGSPATIIAQFAPSSQPSGAGKEVVESVVNGLAYIEEPPPRGQSGFPPNAIAAARAGITLITQQQSDIAFHKHQLATALAERDSLKAQLALAREKYDELIYQVATVWPNESRHDTAKRYIHERENRQPNPVCDAARDAGKGEL